MTRVDPETARRRDRARLKKRRQRAKRKAAAVAALSAAGISKTAPSYRRRLPPLPEMSTKADLRAFLAQAVRNTVGA